MAPPLRLSLCLAITLSAICVSGQIERIKGAHPPVISKFGGQVGKQHHIPLAEGPTNRFSIECHVKGNPAPTVTWYKNDDVIDESSLEGISMPRPEVLEFSSPVISVHEGYYHCQANNTMGLAKSEVILVSPRNVTHESWMSPPELKEQPEVEIVEVENPGKITCVADGVPRPKIEWTFNGDILEDFTDKETLSIRSVNPSHIGTYACNASNVAGYDYKMVYLNILTQPPFFIEKPRDRTVSLGQETILRCGVKGYPKPEIQWFFEGSQITNDSDNFHISSSGDLTIEKILASYEGSFECRAINIYGQNSANASLKVVNTTTIDNGPVTSEAQVKSTIRMNCTVLWDPTFELTVLWKKDNEDLRVDGKRITIDANEHYLTLHDLTFADSGAYTCVAMTQVGTATESGTLTVVGIPPNLITGPSQVTVKEGSDISVLCTVYGLPLPRHTWYKNVDRILFEKESRFEMNAETGTLLIKNAIPEDSAKYICNAENGYGEPVRASAFIDVRKGSKIVQPPEHALLTVGQDVRFDCLVDVDPRLKDSLKVDWFKNQQKLDLTMLPSSNDTFATELVEEEVDLPPARLVLMPNASLQIRSPTEEDLGTYKCQITTGIDEVILEAMLYEETYDWLYIIIIIIICVFAMLIIILCIVCVRKRSKRKGRYGVKDVADGKRRNRSDIQYSIDDDTESLHKELDPELATNRTPIIKSSKKSLLDNNDLKGSENSLLTDEDLWLRKGMDEDGSFRQVYIKE